MRDATTEVTRTTGSNRDDDRQVPCENVALARCYGQIGISAVAAAVRYQGGAKNPAYAPTSNKWRDLFGEAAA
jgi:hypothetical protein